tara:strand:+ start:12562 stop:13086 length:525 start_codon:yes stop_codon:yes gene_type:complete
MAQQTATATFAGGCFWCMEQPFDQLPGVISTTVGYTGGKTKTPTYKAVSGGKTGHTEAVQIVYDPSKVSYKELLAIYWRNIDPTVSNKQFCDKGSQYRAEIFYHNQQQKQLAQQSKQDIINSKQVPKVVTPITKASKFYPAEDYHQNYYEKNPVRYKLYRKLCGRDKRLDELWD